MRLARFRITNFRSIVDSDWVPFSPDGITVLVGQNESGKSSVLEALYFALSTESPTADDFRISADQPVVYLRVEMDPEEVDAVASDAMDYERVALKRYLSNTNKIIDIECYWELVSETGKYDGYCKISDPKLRELITQARDEHVSSNIAEKYFGTANKNTVSESSENTETPGTQAEKAASSVESEADSRLSTELWSALPTAVLFNEESGRLPNQVDIDKRGFPAGPGAQAARNFLQIADVDLSKLLQGDRRAQENTLNRANSRVSEDFNKFWTQTIGQSGKLSLKCDIDRYPNSDSENAGKVHLVFWICDGNTQLYPKQRSQGVRWFISFYLQLKAAEKAKNKRVFLLDEPGANLHSKAQGDVLKLINQLGKDTSTVVYSTHSPQMVEYSKLFRVHAVQRDSYLDDSPSRIIDAHRLGTASTDTLSPVLTAMGVDLSQHQVIRKKNNVLLEEMSGYYYLSSFWKMAKPETEAHFIAATGVNKIEALANMFVGWGLDFVVAVDDDRQGREVIKSLRRELFGDDEVLASKKLLKLPDCPAIEDILEKEDFAKFVLCDETAQIPGTNAEYMKAQGRSKPVLAFQFALAVERGDVTIESFSEASKSRIKKIIDALVQRLT
ncbi:MAG: ATP-binding protein [Gammaproteobacteria bacterium]|nr:ATP-binding protein [Gammaproteobacteria bacterium]MBU1507275.1 ATP-binding protein [Gammaproteobacteria bacterium]MBU2120890.1 ATP-binding protein [Gammaproteobacteria bacterium]MBU2169605.1 ATP-binding protein [Gammaproteobacteria bacterium]MBU2201724.1 ATP-binding protein [Gammaproteobacteria bacterium]